MNVHFIAECDEMPADAFSQAGLVTCEISKYSSVNGVFESAFFIILFIENHEQRGECLIDIAGVGSEAERVIPLRVTTTVPMRARFISSSAMTWE